MSIFDKKIGFDCDDCVIDCLAALKIVARDKYNINISKPRSFDLREAGLSDYQVNDIIVTGLSNWKDLKPIDGSIEFIEEYYKISGNIPIFITYRGNWIPHECTYNWLNYWIPNIPYRVCFLDKNIPKYVAVKNENLDVYIEDRFEYAIEISYYCETVLMISQPWNNHQEYDENNIISIKNWKDIYDISV